MVHHPRFLWTQPKFSFILALKAYLGCAAMVWAVFVDGGHYDYLDVAWKICKYDWIIKDHSKGSRSLQKLRNFSESEVYPSWNELLVLTTNANAPISTSHPHLVTRTIIFPAHRFFTSAKCWPSLGGRFRFHLILVLLNRMDDNWWLFRSIWIAHLHGLTLGKWRFIKHLLKKIPLFSNFVDQLKFDKFTVHAN